MLTMVRAMLFDRHKDQYALALLNEPSKPVHSYNPLVQIERREGTQA
jgi:hypothetical protein